jgi:hypothetical protein
MGARLGAGAVLEDLPDHSRVEDERHHAHPRPALAAKRALATTSGCREALGTSSMPRRRSTMLLTATWNVQRP